MQLHRDEAMLNNEVVSELKALLECARSAASRVKERYKTTIVPVDCENNRPVLTSTVVIVGLGENQRCTAAYDLANDKWLRCVRHAHSKVAGWLRLAGTIN